jgi:DNA-binding NtrC family response regulator
LNVIPIRLPALRERTDDVPLIAEHFLAKYTKEMGKPLSGFSPAAVDRLKAYPWPGNVRELENVIERSLVMCSGTQLDADDIRLEAAPRPRAQADNSFLPEGMTLDQYEQELIREALRRADGNKSQAARLLGLTRNALRYRLTQMGLEA